MDVNWNGHSPDPGTSRVPYKIYNIGNTTSVEVLDFIKTIETSLGKKAVLDMKPMQLGDVKATYADIRDLAEDAGYEPKTEIDEGIAKFVNWYLDYYGR